MAERKASGGKGKKPAPRTSRRTPQARTRKKPADWRPKFLKAFAETGLVTEAAAKAKVGRRTVYDERERNPDFAAKWAELEEWSTEEMEQEARRRAVLGVEKPIHYKGELVTHVREYSDTLLMFLLKARKPEMYRETLNLKHGGKVRHEVVEVPDDAERLGSVGRTLLEIGALPEIDPAEQVPG